MRPDNNTASLIFGIRPVQEALRERRPIDKIFIQNNLRGPHTEELMDELSRSGLPILKVPQQKLDRLTRKNHQGVIAMISPVEFHPLDEVIQSVYERGETPVLLYLDRVTDVRNFGAIVRSAECLGAQAVIVPEKGGAAIGSDAVKTSAGALLRLPVCRVKYPSEDLEKIKLQGIRIVGISEKGNVGIDELDLKGPQLLIMGSEEDGISPSLLKICDGLAQIPMTGEISSLNVGVAAAIALYERQRQSRGE
jgi:23S rRNA (guanosine2251-2'-O)-methyltransferase